MTISIKNIRSANLRAAVTASGISDAAFAEKHGMTRSYLSQLMLGTCAFGEKTATSLEKKLRLAPGHLSQQNPDDSLRTIDVWESLDDLPPGVFAMIPRVAIELSAGNGSIANRENDLPPLAFREDWIRRKNVTSRSNLRVCDVRGDSMEPYLEDGDTVLIDTGQQDIVDNEVYAIAYGNDLRIKRIAKRFDGGLFVRSDNPKYPEEIISPTDMEHVRVLGRKLWRGG
jgi:phage repressor protein C with HTH and peptisase S24 domain